MSVADPSSPWTVPAGARPALVSALQVDTRFRSAIPRAERALAARACAVTRVVVEHGRWDPAELLESDGAATAVLVLRGVIRQDLHLGGRVSSQLMGPGDVLRPWKPAYSSLTCATRWIAVGRATLAILGSAFSNAARRWPGLNEVVQDALNDQLSMTARQMALTALPRVEDRVLGMFWLLSERWGIVTPDGIAIRLDLTHELIGQLIGAKRPTVSLALTSLSASGHLHRSSGDRGLWVLSLGSARVFADGASGSEADRLANAIADGQSSIGLPSLSALAEGG